MGGWGVWTRGGGGARGDPPLCQLRSVFSSKVLHEIHKIVALKAWRRGFSDDLEEGGGLDPRGGGSPPQKMCYSTASLGLVPCACSPPPNGSPCNPRQSPDPQPPTLRRPPPSSPCQACGVTHEAAANHQKKTLSKALRWSPGGACVGAPTPALRAHTPRLSAGQRRCGPNRPRARHHSVRPAHVTPKPREGPGGKY